MTEPPRKRLKTEAGKNINKSTPTGNKNQKEKALGSSSVGTSTSSSTSSPDSFLSGIKALIIENGLGKTRVSILTEKLIKHGGECHTFNIQESTTHILVAPNIKFERLPKLLGLGVNPVHEHLLVVRADWLSKCLTEGKMVNVEPYLVSSPNKVVNKISCTEVEGATCESGGGELEKLLTFTEGEVSTTSTSEQHMHSENSFVVSKVPDRSTDRMDSDSDFVDSGDEVTDNLTEGSLSGSPVKVATTVLNLKSSPEKNKGKWICALPSTSQGINHNQHITEKLQVLATSYANTKDQWRALGYKKAISSIKSYHKKIETQEECSKLPFVGEKLAKKIWEIVETGHLRRLDHIDPKMAAINLFSDVWGAGPKTAEIWVSKGLRSLEDLKEYGNLNRQQQIGLKYFEEFIERMPREEAGRIGEQVKLAAEAIKPGLMCVTCGSYRRQKPTCGDVDVLVSHPDGKSHHGVMGQLLQELKRTGFITDDLVSVDNLEQKKYLGVCKLPGESTKHRRLDIIVVPYNELGCALMYFTGSDYFNRSMRLLARKNGMSLSEHSLNTGVVRKGGEKIYEGTPLPIFSERDVFETLGLEYREPHERDW